MGRDTLMRKDYVLINIEVVEWKLGFYYIVFILIDVILQRTISDLLVKNIAELQFPLPIS